MQRKTKKNFIRKKLSSRRADSIVETLVAILVAALALAILAGMISTASRLIMESQSALDAYYAESNRLTAQSGDADGTGYVIVKNYTEQDKVNLILGESASGNPVNLFINKESRDDSVISYRLQN